MYFMFVLICYSYFIQWIYSETLIYIFVWWILARRDAAPLVQILQITSGNLFFVHGKFWTRRTLSVNSSAEDHCLLENTDENYRQRIRQIIILKQSLSRIHGWNWRAMLNNYRYSTPTKNYSWLSLPMLKILGWKLPWRKSRNWLLTMKSRKS